MIIALLCVLFCACVTSWWSARLRESRAHPLPPSFSAQQLPIIGHLHHLLIDTKQLWELLQIVAQDTIKQGGVTYAKMNSEICYLITDPDDAYTVANTCMKKHYIYGFTENWLGQGLITSSGEVWHRHRKLLNPAFSLPRIHGFLGVFNSQSKILLSNFDSYVGKGKFNPSPPLKQSVLGTSCLTVFGKNNVKESVFHLQYMKAVDEISFMVVQRVQKFWLHYDAMYKLFGLRKKESELVQTLGRISDEAIQTKRTAALNEVYTNTMTTDAPHKPLLELLVEQATRNPFSDQEIKEEVDTAIVASFDTTTHLLECVLVLVGSYPKVQQKVYEELMQVLGSDRDVEKDDLKNLVYTDAVIKETLRLLPILPVVGRNIDRDVKLKNFTMRAGTQCLLLLLGIHRHPSWGSDADQFRPERWLDAASLPSNNNAFAAFSIGKRSCIGRTYALTSVKVTLAHVVRKFQVTSDFSKLQFKLDITLKPVAGNEISLQRRN